MFSDETVCKAGLEKLVSDESVTNSILLYPIALRFPIGNKADFEKCSLMRVSPILLYSTVLYSSILFYSILLYSILFCPILFYSFMVPDW